MVLNDIIHVYEKLLSKYIPACVYEIVELYIIGINTNLKLQDLRISLCIRHLE